VDRCGDEWYGVVWLRYEEIGMVLDRGVRNIGTNTNMYGLNALNGYAGAQLASSERVCTTACATGLDCRGPGTVNHLNQEDNKQAEVL